MSLKLLRPALAGLIFAAALGCGAGRGTVSGSVTVRGAPMTRGLVSFIPAQGEPHSYAVIEGKYGPLDVPVGDYEVCIRIVEPPGGAPAVAMTEVKGAGPVDGRKPALTKGKKQTIDPKYEDPRSSGLKTNIKPGVNTYDIPL